MYDYKLINSDRHSVSLEIEPDGTLVVRAPKRYKRADTDKFVLKNEKWIQKRLPGVLAKKSVFDTVTDTEALREQARALLTRLTEEYAQIMNVQPKSIKITGAQKRFGSCSATNGICYSYYLMFYPIEGIKYVVVHELSHILHHNHSKFFHQTVKKYLENSDEFEKMLAPRNASITNYEKNLEIVRKHI